MFRNRTPVLGQNIVSPLMRIKICMLVDFFERYPEMPKDTPSTSLTCLLIKKMYY